ncbi:MAG: HAD family phosphatase [Candidatus Omnitrophica bacterium]|nr:HAD family phosphatase [Candidatus Omnitrophota bacterium]
MYQIQNLIFDIGNVLLTFNPRPFMRDLFSDPDRADACFRLTIQSPEWRELDSGRLSVEQAAQIFKQREPSFAPDVDLFFQRWLEMFQPIDETIRLLPLLRRRGHKLYVLSNFIRESFTALRPALSFLDHFDGVVVSYEAGMVKPDREIYEFLLSKFHLAPKECIFIDDMEANVRGAQNAGVNTILFESPRQLIEQLEIIGIL